MIPTSYPIFVTGTLLLALLIGYSAFRSAQLLRTWRPPTNPLLMPSENALRVLLVVICVLLGLISGLDRQTLGWTLPDAVGQIIRGVVWGAGLAIFFRLTTLALIALTGQRFYSPLVMELILPRSRRELMGLALAMIPVVLLEELLYRSLLVGGLSPLLPAPLLVVGIGVLFGLLHSPQGAWGMVGAGAAGVVFGALFLLEGSLLLPIVAHYIANMAQIAWAMRSKMPTPT